MTGYTHIPIVAVVLVPPRGGLLMVRARERGKCGVADDSHEGEECAPGTKLPVRTKGRSDRK